MLVRSQPSVQNRFYMEKFMIIIGSTALQYHELWNNPKDTDILHTECVEGYDAIILPQEIIEEFPAIDGYATLDALYTLCCSHLGWDIKWEKHKQRALYMKACGARIIPNLYYKLVEHWRKENGNKEYLSLYKKKTDFFNDYVEYVYDHDYLHSLVALPYNPVYTLCLKENEDVAIDKDKFFSLTYKQQLQMFREEISVIAIERWMLPDKVKGKYSFTKAYNLALHKTCVSLTKNWATDFIIFNLKELNKPDYKMFENVFKSIEEGEMYMSKVDMSVFEELAELVKADSINTIVFLLCQNEFGDMVPYEGSYDVWIRRTGELEEMFEYEHLEQDGGGEGGGEYCYGVFKLKGKTYKAEYLYYSYQGHDYEDILSTLREVKPVEKTIVVYE